MNDFNFEDAYSEIHKKKAERMNRAAEEAREARTLASDSTKVIKIQTHHSTYFYKCLSDVHMPKTDMYGVIDEIITYGKIPGMLIEIGGDAFDTAIKLSVGASQTSSKAVGEAVFSFAKALKERARQEGIDLKQLIAAIRRGNHEKRAVNEVEMCPSEMLAYALELEDRYAESIALIQVEVLDENDKVISTDKILSQHGTDAPGKPGAQADNGLATNQVHGVDVVINEHNHKIMIASQNKEYHVPGRVNPIRKSTTFVNFGAFIENEKYSDSAGYPFPRKSDKEIVRISHINNQKIIDLLNLRSLINSSSEEIIKEYDSKLKALEQETYKTENEIEKAYAKVGKKYLNLQMKKHVENETEKVQVLKNSGLSNKLFFAPLSGFDIGNEDRITNEKEIEEVVKVLSRLNGSCKVALNGNIVHYKKAFTLVNKNGGLLGEKFPEDSFAYLEKAAKFLMPIKNKIMVMNSGENEEKLMKYQSEALAKMAMTRLQMPENLCYMPYNKIKLEAEQLKIQAKQVEAYNKSILEKAVSVALRDVKKAIKEALPYKFVDYDKLTDEAKEALFEKIINVYNAKANEEKKSNVDKNNNVNKDKKSDTQPKLDFLKDIISAKLRHEDVFLSLTKDKDYINFEFPLEDIELRTPHENLIWHILCAFLEIDPKKVVINSNSKKPSYATAKVKDDKGKTRVVEFFGGFANSTSGRSAIDSNLKGTQSSTPGAHVYYTNTKLGKEFMLLDKQIYENPFTNKSEKKDVIFISGGTFSKESPSSVNKIYKLLPILNNQEKEISTGMYINNEEPFRLYCESLNYETALYDQDIMEGVLERLRQRSFAKTVRKFNAYKTEMFISKSNAKMESLHKKDDNKKANKDCSKGQEI